MRYLCWCALPFCAAVFLCCLLPLWSLCFLFAALALIVFLIFILRRHRNLRLVLVAFGAMLGCLWFGIYTAVVAQPMWNLDEKESAFTATVAAYPTGQSYGVSVSVHMESGPAQGRRVLLWLSEDYEWLKPGDKLTGTASFTSADLAKDEEYSSYTSRGVFLMADAQLSQAVSVSGMPPRFFPAFLGHKLKEAADAVMTGDDAGLLKGLLTGDRSGLSDAVSSDFSRAGLSHLLAVSGLHVGFLTGILFLLPGNRRRRAFVAIPVLICFALLTGGKPSVWRAVVMSSLLLLAPVFHREADSPTSLSFALLVLLVQNPYASLSVGLQLSFAAVTGLLFFQQPLQRWMQQPLVKRREKGPGWRALGRVWTFVTASISTSCAAIVLTLPLSAWYFKTVSLVAPLTNLLALWVATCAFALGFFACVLYWIFRPLAYLLAVPTRWALHWLLGVASHLGRWSYSALRLDNPYYLGWFFALLAIIVLTLLFRGLRQRPLLPVCSTVALLFIAMTCRAGSLTASMLTVTALDVGMGSCTVFSSGGAFAAVDCGGEDAGNLLADYLQSAGVSDLDLLMLTHLDSDHTNGVEQLMNRVHVDRLALSAQEEFTSASDELVTLSEAHGCELVWVESTVNVCFGQSELTIFPPVDEGDNEGCISALCSWEEHNILVTGDLPQEQEELLLEREDLPRLDVLIVGHHGSSTSTSYSLLSATLPGCAVISVGENNSYGLPNADVLERLSSYRCDIYRTDQNGTVIIRFNEE